MVNASRSRVENRERDERRRFARRHLCISERRRSASRLRRRAHREGRSARRAHRAPVSPRGYARRRSAPQAEGRREQAPQGPRQSLDVDASRRRDEVRFSSRLHRRARDRSSPARTIGCAPRSRAASSELETRPELALIDDQSHLTEAHARHAPRMETNGQPHEARFAFERSRRRRNQKARGVFAREKPSFPSRERRELGHVGRRGTSRAALR